MKYSLLPILCVFALATTSHGVDALQELQAAYPAVQKDGYTYIKMDHVMPGGSAVMDVMTLRLSYRKGSDPQNDPLVIVNYSAEGYPESERQSKLLNKVLPAMAKRSTKPIIFIDVTAIKNNEQDLPETVHLGSLLGELEDNELGPNDTAIELKDNGYLLPYGYVAVNGKKTYDFSYSVYSETVEDKKIQVAIVSHLLGVISESNKKTGSENNSSQ